MRGWLLCLGTGSQTDRLHAVRGEGAPWAVGRDSLSPAELEGMERENKVYSLCEIVGIQAAGGGTCIFNSLSAVRQY